MNELRKGMAGDSSQPHPPQRKRYAAPVLTVFGRVAALTQSASGCSANDSPTCTTGATMGPKASDRRAKQDIRRVGTHPWGIGLYLFAYKPPWHARYGAGPQFGVMADEVEDVMPQAVSIDPSGYKMVDYAMLGIRIGA